jgi:putative membrane protein
LGVQKGQQMMFKTLVPLAFVVAALSANGQTFSGSPTQAFVTAAAQSDEFERQEGRLAARQASAPRVRAFGRMMVIDHTRTTAALKVALRRAHLPPPAPPVLTPNQARKIALLRGLHGDRFDQAFIGQQVDAHQAALSILQEYAVAGDNSVIQKAAAGTVPLVRRHLDMARRIQAGAGKP